MKKTGSLEQHNVKCFSGFFFQFSREEMESITFSERGRENGAL